MRSLVLCTVVFFLAPALAVAAEAPAAKVSTDPKVEGTTEAVFDPAEYPPYFMDAGRQKAVSDLQDGHAAAALRSLPASPTDLPTRFLRAQALVATGDDAHASKELEAIAAAWPAMAPRCHCLAAASFENLGDIDHSIEAWVGCAQDPPHARTAPLAAARLLEKQGKHGRALELLAPLRTVTGYPHSEVLLLIGKIQQASGNLKEAMEALRDVYINDPLTPAAEAAHSALIDLTRRMHISPVSEAQSLDRVDRMLSLKQPKHALREMERLHFKPVCSGLFCQAKRCHAAGAAETDTEDAASPDTADEEVDEPTPEDAVPADLLPAKRARPFSLAQARDDEDKPDARPEMPVCKVSAPAKPADPLACRAQLLRAEAQSHSKGLRRKALADLRIVYERCADPEVRARALFAAQAAASRINDNDAYDLAAIDGLQFPKSALADDALLAASVLARNNGDSHTERLLLHHLVQTYPDSELRAEALFRLFWSHRADGRPDRGLRYLDILTKEYDNGPRGDGGDSERGRYWWGRTVYANAVKEDRPRGLDALVALARDRPTTYYGLLARSFISSVDPREVVSPAECEPYDRPLRLGLLQNDRAFVAAVELWRMGELDEARDLLLATDFKALHADGVRGQEATLIVAELLQKMGSPRMAHAIARRELLGIIRDGNDPLGRRAALVCYPLAFRDAVSTYAMQAGFAPDFLQGLMREESALDPHARSPVGARGLTQLMPRTAKVVARSLGLRRFSVNELWEPDTNIEIGSAYLGKMLKLFGHPGLAAAAYNAGPNAVARWLSNAKCAFDEFVEDIPFSETRGYVKRVLRSYAAYSYLYESPAIAALRVSLLLPQPELSPADLQ